MLRREIEKRITMAGFEYVGSDIDINTGDEIDIYKNIEDGQKYGVIVRVWGD